VTLEAREFCGNSVMPSFKSPGNTGNWVLGAKTKRWNAKKKPLFFNN
jgi:hypothetical protein